MLSRDETSNTPNSNSTDFRQLRTLPPSARNAQERWLWKRRDWFISLISTDVVMWIGVQW